MLFLYINNLLLNIIFNSTPIYRYKDFILPQEVTKVLYNILLYRSLCSLYLSNKVLPYIVL